MSKSTGSKYKNIKSEGFDSLKEKNRYYELKLLEQIGEISNLQRQVKYLLIPAQKAKGRIERPISYIADFVYTQDGDTVVEDVKGYRKGNAYSIFVIKRKLMLQVYGIEVKEV